jgi:uncharacterized protein
MILLQASGFRRPIHSERAIGLPFGAGLGVLYPLTPISGPPLALVVNNQGFVRPEFRTEIHEGHKSRPSMIAGGSRG